METFGVRSKAKHTLWLYTEAGEVRYKLTADGPEPPEVVEVKNDNGITDGLWLLMGQKLGQPGYQWRYRPATKVLTVLAAEG